MKVVSIDNWIYHLTKGNIYDIVRVDVFSDTSGTKLFEYKIINNNGYEHYIEGFVIRPLRDDNLNKLGI